MMKHTGKYHRPGGAYVSEFEEFMHGFLAQHPEVEEDRRRGWDIWWDHRVDLDELDKQRENELRVKPYVYE
ncbi:DUF3460 family protein [Massilia pseudoviolaceinigra]|uniref:DUF3460 family protein n=1 Tax=Massilia pseudoviolaceinigra TaxID=3057165 RepID=UPI00279697C1|nr:DUF3460 family protein [Massilia sp. CCM 9206]MDQ1920566.1 DUF3460 family protein [Massilia sp. CCM 9206]